MRGIKDCFLTGLVVLLPLTLTGYVLWLIYRVAYNVFGPHTPFAQLMRRFLGFYIPGLDVVASLGVVLVVGVVARHWLGRRLVHAAEAAFLRIPLVRKLYWVSRQLAPLVLRPEASPQSHMVLVEFPQPGSYVLGVLTAEKAEKVSAALGQQVSIVYLPTAPNPLSGWVLFVPQERLQPVPLTVEEGMGLILSGGFALPQEARHAHSQG
ncbi:MAG: DUF502 domain-containing protein [Candidatus Bipolaricaulaceae bacterium]